MLTVKNLCKKFGSIKAVDEISFDLKKGEIAVLLGENGAGKSTLLRIISGYLEPDAGEVEINGVNLRQDRMSFLRQIGYVQEVSSLYTEMTVAEFLEFVANIREINSLDIAEKVKNVINILELNDVVVQNLETLSKGFKKRVELAAVLVAEPEVVLLDEPTEGLDPLQKETIRKIIKKYAKKHTILISTHALEDAEALNDRVLLMRKGKMLANESFSEFKKAAKNDLLASFKKITGV
ncbi:MAG: ABC transporter ATP-binding protein [Alphaproteobacteria bacterium]|nr:ABC transporter ATP-binding protein [Alphaproteobacteria bacterium]